MSIAHVHPILRLVRQVAQRAAEADVPDELLLVRFVEHGDESAFAALVQRYGPLVWGVCRRLLGNGPDAEDCFQATFLVLVRKARSLARPELLGNWLYGVAHRTALKARRDASRRKVREKVAETVATINPADEAARRDLRRALDAALSQLPELYRAPIVLCYLEGQTHEEAARCLRCPRKTVTTRLARACQQLRGRLARRGLVLSGGAVAAGLLQEAASSEVAASVMDATVRAAAACRAGKAPAGAAVSAPVAELTEGVVRAMSLSRIRTAIVRLVAIIGIVSAGGGAVHYLAQAEGPAPDGARVGPNQEVKLTDQQRLQGTWQVLSAELDGKAAPEQQRWKGVQITIRGDRMIRNPTTEPSVAIFTLNPAMQPKELVAKSLDKPEKGTATWIYRFEGEKLTLCGGNKEKKPTSFDTKAGDGRILMVLQKLPGPAPEPGDLEKLQGTWEALSGEIDGKESPPAVVKDFRLLIRQNRLIFNQATENRQSTFTLDPARKPKEIAVTPADGGGKPPTVIGIYRLEGDKLTLCINNDATKTADKPDSFQTKPGDGRRLLVLKRMNP